LVQDLGAEGCARRLRSDGLGVRLGPFEVLIRSDVRAIEAALFRLYRDFELLDGARVFSFHVQLSSTRAFPTLRPLVRFSVDGRVPHEDLPHAHALAVLEWGLNLVIALRCHSLLMFHCACLEKDGGVLLLPAMPGHGKTTLCAALAHRGWRLFSDEFGLLRPESLELVPIPRPMPLKNESIAVIRAFAPEAELGPTIPNTRKGTIVHVKPPRSSIEAAHQTGRIRWIVFPRWVAGASLACLQVNKFDAFMALATNAFNFEVLGEQAFTAVRDIVDEARSYRLSYSNLDEAVEAVNSLAV
jgi:HprK-related kinase A